MTLDEAIGLLREVASTSGINAAFFGHTLDEDRLIEAVALVDDAIQEGERVAELTPLREAGTRALGTAFRGREAELREKIQEAMGTEAPAEAVAQQAGEIAGTQSTQDRPPEAPQPFTQPPPLADQFPDPTGVLGPRPQDQPALRPQLEEGPPPAEQVNPELRARLLQVALLNGMTPQDVNEWIAGARDVIRARRVRESLGERGFSPDTGLTDPAFFEAQGIEAPDQALLQQARTPTVDQYFASFGDARTLDEMVERFVGELESNLEGDPFRRLVAQEGTLPESFRAIRQEELDPADRSRFGGRAQVGIDVKPVFREQDVLSIGFMPTEEVKRIEKRLVEAGLLTANRATGRWGPESQAAYRTVLGYANENGITDPTQAMEEMIALAPTEEDILATNPFVARPYVRPDFDTLAQSVKSYARSQIGREPSDTEMKQLTSVMSGLYRQEYEAQVKADRLFHEAVVLAQAGEEFTQPGVVQGVDPAASFQEQFDQRFAPEIERLEALGDIARNQENVMESMRTMQGLIP